MNLNVATKKDSTSGLTPNGRFVRGQIRSLSKVGDPFLLVLLVVAALGAQAELPYPQGAAFPLLMYEVPAEAAPKLAAFGWNVFHTYGLRTTNGWEAYLAKLPADEAGALTAIPAEGKIAGRTAWPKAKVEPWVRSLSARTNLAWWDLPEEARPWMDTDLAMLRNYTAWSRAQDPARRPVFEYTANNRTAAELGRLTPFVDILGISCYCESVDMPHAWVRYKVREVGLGSIALAGATPGADYLRGQKIPLAVLYCAKNDRAKRVASPEQVYHDFWSAIAAGAQGIGVFAYYHALRDDPALPKNLQRLNEAAAQISGAENIGDAVLRGAPEPGVRFTILSGPEKTVSFRPKLEKKDFQYPSLNVLAKTRNGTLFVIAVNSTDQNVTARLSGLPRGASGSLPFEARSVTVDDGGNSTDTFMPWGVHIYKLKEQPAN